MSFSGYPKALSYAFGRLEGFSKITQRVEPNRRDDVKAGSTIKVAIEPNTLWNLRSFCMYYDFTVNKVGANSAGDVQSRFHPRLSSSIIDTIAIYMNNYQVDNCADYNLLYNTLWDMSAGNDQVSRRFLEMTDPSISVTDSINAEKTEYDIFVQANNTMDAVDKSHTRQTCVINSWANFLGNSGVEYLDTNDTGLTEISIRLAPSTICWKGGERTADADKVPAAGVSKAEYKLDNIYFTYSKIVFKDTMYEQIKHDALMTESGLRVKFTSYETHTGALQHRSINYQFSTNASSLDTIIATTRRKDYDVEDFLQLTNAETNEITYFNLASDSKSHKAFNQSKYFRRDLSGLKDSQFFINGTAMSQRALTPAEVFTETTIALNDQNDLNASYHKGLCGLPQFLKFYFAHVLSLNYNGETSIPTISGLDGGGSSFTILWKTNCDTNLTADDAQVYPVVFTASSRVLVINAGKQVSVEI